MNIIVTGSIAYDYLMRFPGRFTESFVEENLKRVSLSFLVEDMTKHWGGIGANISFTLALLGLRPHLFGTVGRDFGDYRRWLEDVGVDTSTVRQIDDVFCASFFANTDLDNNQIASFYSGAMAYARDYSLADVYAGLPDWVIISPNDPIAMKNYARECRQRGIRFISDPSQQIPRFTGDDLHEVIDGAYALIVNDYEASMICEKMGVSLIQLGERVKVLIVTHGADGSRIFTNGQTIETPVVPPMVIKDPTGVGDAYRAGLLFGLANDLPLQLCGELGALAATYVLEQVGTQSHRFTLADFITRFRRHFDDQGILDRLLAMEKA
jgi:adenosine kinase